MKTLIVGVNLFTEHRRTDGRTDGQVASMTKLIVTFRNFAHPRANYREGNFTIC
jgi:hypothetical protein